jgi:glycosyltransferase involved in cell wall biosynthesis
MRIAYCRPAHSPLVRDAKFIRTYQRLGHDVVFFGNSRCRPATDEAPLCTYRHVGVPYPYFSRLVPPGTAAYNAALVRWLVAARPALVHAGDFESLPAAVLYKRACAPRCRVVYDIADTYSARYRIPSWMAATIQWVDDQLMSECDMVIVPQHNRLGNFLCRRPRRHCILPNCPHLADAPPLRPWPPTPPLRLMLSGLLAWTRGVKELTEAARVAGGVEVIAVGLYDAGVREYLEASGVARTYPLMNQEQVLALSADCHLIAAFYDPARRINRQAAPNKIFDAMAVARPVLLNTEVEIAPQVIDQWQCGYALPYHDCNAVARLFRQVAADPAEAQRLGGNGRKRFETEFHWEALAPVIEDYLTN